MDPLPLEQVVRNLNHRLGHAEQILPTLATKDDLHEAIAPLATRDELLATTGDLRKDIRDSEERTRRHFDVVAERLEGHIRLVADGQVVLQERVDELRTDLRADLARLDKRMMRLEATR